MSVRLRTTQDEKLAKAYGNAKAELQKGYIGWEGVSWKVENWECYETTKKLCKAEISWIFLDFFYQNFGGSELRRIETIPEPTSVIQLSPFSTRVNYIRMEKTECR